jgi:predicted metal-dependent hydrolase
MFDEPSTQLSLWSDGDATDGWGVRESPRARRLTVRVFHSGRVEVVVPVRTSQLAVDRFIRRHRPWIDKKRAEARRDAPPPEPFPPRVIELAGVSQTWRLHVAAGRGRPRVTVASAGLLRLSGDVGDGRGVQQALRAWLLRHAANMFAPLLEACAREMGVTYRRIAVRRQRTRWGSCSVRGTISLNCCLLYQRPEVMRYLLVHELAHVEHMNHSARFWALVGQHCPDCRRLDRELLDGWRRVPSWVFRDCHQPA